MIWSQRRQDLMPPVVLEGAQVYMRPPRLEDAQPWAVVRHRNRAYLKPFEPAWDANCLSQGYFERRLTRQADDWENGSANAFLIFRKDGNELIGGMNINHICRGAGQYASLGYWIDEAHQGQGYMAESLQLTLKYAFGELQLHRVHAACIVKNERSKKLLLRAGFIKEGYAERYICIDGEWQDHHLFGITFEDWQKQKSGSAPVDYDQSV